MFCLVGSTYGWLAISPAKRSLADSSSDSARSALHSGVSLNEEKAAPSIAEALSESAWATMRAAGDLSMFMLGEISSKFDASLDPLGGTGETTATKSFIAALQSGIQAGKASFMASRQNVTVIDVTAAPANSGVKLRPVSSKARKTASSFYMLRTTPSSRQSGLSPEAQRTKELLLSGPHSPLYSTYRKMTEKGEEVFDI